MTELAASQHGNPHQHHPHGSAAAAAAAAQREHDEQLLLRYIDMDEDNLSDDDVDDDADQGSALNNSSANTKKRRCPDVIALQEEERARQQLLRSHDFSSSSGVDDDDRLDRPPTVASRRENTRMNGAEDDKDWQQLSSSHSTTAAAAAASADNVFDALLDIKEHDAQVRRRVAEQEALERQQASAGGDDDDDDDEDDEWEPRSPTSADSEGGAGAGRVGFPHDATPEEHRHQQHMTWGTLRRVIKAMCNVDLSAVHSNSGAPSQPGGVGQRRADREKVKVEELERLLGGGRRGKTQAPPELDPLKLIGYQQPPGGAQQTPATAILLRQLSHGRLAPLRRLGSEQDMFLTSLRADVNDPNGIGQTLPSRYEASASSAAAAQPPPAAPSTRRWQGLSNKFGFLELSQSQQQQQDQQQRQQGTGDRSKSTMFLQAVTASSPTDTQNTGRNNSNSSNKQQPQHRSGRRVSIMEMLRLMREHHGCAESDPSNNNHQQQQVTLVASPAQQQSPSRADSYFAANDTTHRSMIESLQEPELHEASRDVLRVRKKKLPATYVPSPRTVQTLRLSDDDARGPAAATLELGAGYFAFHSSGIQRQSAMTVSGDVSSLACSPANNFMLPVAADRSQRRAATPHYGMCRGKGAHVSPLVAQKRALDLLQRRRLHQTHSALSLQSSHGGASHSSQHSQRNRKSSRQSASSRASTTTQDIEQAHNQSVERLLLELLSPYCEDFEEKKDSDDNTPASRRSSASCSSEATRQVVESMLCELLTPYREGRGDVADAEEEQREDGDGEAIECVSSSGRCSTDLGSHAHTSVSSSPFAKEDQTTHDDNDGSKREEGGDDPSAKKKKNNRKGKGKGDQTAQLAQQNEHERVLRDTVIDPSTYGTKKKAIVHQRTAHGFVEGPPPVVSTERSVGEQMILWIQGQPRAKMLFLEGEDLTRKVKK